MNKEDFSDYISHLTALIQYVRKREINGGVQEELDIVEEFVNRLLKEREYVAELNLNMEDLNALYPDNTQKLIERGVMLLQEEDSMANKMKIGSWGSDVLTAIKVMKLKEQMMLNNVSAKIVIDGDVE